MNTQLKFNYNKQENTNTYRLFENLRHTAIMELEDNQEFENFWAIGKKLRRNVMLSEWDNYLLEDLENKRILSELQNISIEAKEKLDIFTKIELEEIINKLLNGIEANDFDKDFAEELLLII